MKKRKNGEDQSSEAAPPHFSRYWRYGLVLAVILLFAFIRVRLRDMPLERDEGEYAYAGQLILQGIPPYQLAYNMKLPGSYAAYAVILSVFGQTPAGIHYGLLLVNAATTLLVFLLAARLFGSLAGVVAGATYALLSSSPSVLGLAGHATHFVVLPAVAGILLLLKAIEQKRTWLFFWSGLLLGLAFVMKQPGMLFPFFAGLYLLKTESSPPIDYRGLARRLGVLALGVVLPFALTCLLMLRAGVFRKFWFWTFSYASQYGTNVSLADGAHLFWMTLPRVLAHSASLWIIAAVGLTALWWNPKARMHAVFAGWFLLFSFLAVCPGFYFREHYFILMLPAVSLLAGAAVSSATESLGRMGALRALPALVFFIAFAYSVIDQREFFFDLNPLEACRSMYWPNPFPEAVQVADYIKSHTPEGARIAVLGSEPEIYFYSGRHSATGYIYTYGLMEPQKYASTMQQDMVSEIEAAHPQFLVYVDVPLSWLAQPRSDPFIFDWTKKYVQDQYELVGIADIGRTTEYRWGEDARIPPRNPQWSVQVFKRKAS